MKRITIYDVAKEAEVSLATVSRVINASEVVREDTRVKVQEAIEKLGYKPNAIAQGLALQKTTTIALIVPEASFFYTGQIINGLIDVAKIYKYNIVLHTTTEGITGMNDIVETIIKSRVDGVVIFNDKLCKEELNALTRYQVPIVVIGDHMGDDAIGSVYVDYGTLIFDYITSYLDKGIKNIALIEDRKNPAIMKQLKAGIDKAYDAKGLKFDQFISIPKEYRSSYLYLKEYFKNHKHDLILTYRDSQAMAVLNSANENGLTIPNDMELVCVLDSKYNAMARPQISGFKIPDYDLGAVAMRVMTKMLKEDGEVFDKEIELSYIYTPRQSTK
ncbi:MAG: LacI family DNA-binding transcriptional regulator [Erysipelotrichaceae bacterium]